MDLVLYISVVFGICSCLEIVLGAEVAVKVIYITNSCLDQTMTALREWLFRRMTGPVIPAATTPPRRGYIDSMR
jgi:hypothetical protein